MGASLQRSFLFASALCVRSITAWGIILPLLFRLQFLHYVGRVKVMWIQVLWFWILGELFFFYLPPKALCPVVSLVFKSFHKQNSLLRVLALYKVLSSNSLPPKAQSFICYTCVGINTKPLGSRDKYPLVAQALTPVLFHFTLCLWHLGICFYFFVTLAVLFNVIMLHFTQYF